MFPLIETVSIAATLLLSYTSVIFLLATLKRDNSIMDIAYGPAFLFCALGTMLVREDMSPLSLLILATLTLWSTRLAFRIAKKNWNKPEDVRYAAWRNTWMKRGATYFYLRSYLQIFILQGAIIGVVLLPFLIATTTPAAVSWVTLLGGSIFAIGLGIESVADWQLDRFLARKRAGTEPALLMTAGLFRYSRRPNYFGETLIWWGLACMVLELPYGWLALASPLLITFIVTRVTGPMLEEIFLKKYPEEYRAYMAQTSYFIPLPPRRP